MSKTFSIALSESLESELRRHLDRADGQEDLCFGTWTPLSGAERDAGIITSAILPLSDERDVHGNAAFHPQYLTRAIARAAQRNEGLVFMHSHVGPGWQGMSDDDVAAEQRISPAALAATGHPLIGMTSGTDGSWSGRRWDRIAERRYHRVFAENIRVIGDALRVTPLPRRTNSLPALERTTSVWGNDAQERLARLRVAVVGLGSVGSAVAEGLARMGVETLTLIDHDTIEERNLDRLTNADKRDIGKAKVDVAEAAVKRFSTASQVRVLSLPQRCDEPEAIAALVDCDAVFSCVDRPWPRRILNQLSMAALIPVVDAGILVRRKGDRLVGADCHVRIVGPGRRCLQCWRSFDPSEAAMDRDGLLDDPNYIKQMDPADPLLARANVFPFAMTAAALSLTQYAAMVIGPIHNLGDQNLHFVTGRIDAAADVGCEPDCPYPGLTGLGDQGLPPVRRYQ